MYSADVSMEDILEEEPESKFEKWLTKVLGERLYERTHGIFRDNRACNKRFSFYISSDASDRPFFQNTCWSSVR